MAGGLTFHSTAHPRAIDENFEKLCEDALEALEASNHEKDDVIKTCREFIIKRMNQIVDSQLITPEKQRELGQKFLKAQGRGVSWGEEERFNVGRYPSFDLCIVRLPGHKPWQG